MKFKFKKLSKKQKDDYTFKGCDVCCLVGKKECKTTPCGGGYMIEIKRPSKHERLLKALLSVVCLYDDGMATCNCKKMKASEAKQLIAIKESMEKGAVK